MELVAIHHVLQYCLTFLCNFLIIMTLSMMCLVGINAN